MEWFDLITKFFDKSFASRWTGACSGWTKELVLAHVAVDLCIWLAYMTIPLFLIRIVRNRKDIPFNLMFFLFALFIVGCGLTHLAGAITSFFPYYYMDFWIKAVTALASIGTAWVLWKEYPRIVSMPNPYTAVATIKRISQYTQDLGIFVLDKNGIVQSWSAGAEKLQGYQEEEIIGSHFSRFYPNDSKTRADEALRTALREGKYEEDGIRVRKDGSRFWANIVVTPLYEDGMHYGFSKVVKDITGKVEQLENANKELEEINKDLEDANKELENFSLVAAHDLQDPMKQNIVFLKMIQEGKTEFISQVVKNNMRMNNFIKNLLEFARSGGSTLKIESHSVQSILKGVLNDLAVRIKETGAKITVKEMPTIKCDYVQLGRVFQNLLSNAMKCKSPDRPLEIEINSELRKNTWVFSVKDNGIGIPADQIKNLFTIYKGKKNDTTGAGFGLAICKRIVESHKGMIQAQSEEGKGSTFTFTIGIH